MENYITDNELSRIISQRIKQAIEEITSHRCKPEHKAIVRAEAIDYIEELLAELITEERNK